MRNLQLFLWNKEVSKFIILLFILIAIPSCSKDDDIKPDEEDFNTVYLVSFEHKKNIPLELASSYIALAEFQNSLEGDYASKIVSGVDVYNVTYNTTHLGNKIIASGVVCLPSDVEDFLLVSFQNGTNVEYVKAPTLNSVDLEFSLLYSMGGLGFAIAVPDYIGFGASESAFHPYIYKPSTVSAVRDLISAVKELCILKERELSGDLYLTGYSFGGWASLVSHKSIEDNPISEFKLIGSACGAGSYDLPLIRDYLVDQTDYPQPFYIPYILLSYQSVGIISEPLSTYFKEPFATDIPLLFDFVNTASEINKGLNSNMSELLTNEFITEFGTNENFNSIKLAMQNNSQAAWVLDQPISLYHGTLDENVPFSVSNKLFNDFINKGVPAEKIKLITMEGKNHSTGLFPMLYDVIGQLIE